MKTRVGRPRNAAVRTSPLTQLGIAVQLTANTFLILLGGVALAAALAFGIGGREVAREIIQKAYDRSNEVTGSSSGGNRR